MPQATHGVRTCTDCLKVQPVERFYVKYQRPTGPVYDCRCKRCRSRRAGRRAGWEIVAEQAAKRLPERIRRVVLNGLREQRKTSDATPHRTQSPPFDVEAARDLIRRGLVSNATRRKLEKRIRTRLGCKPRADHDPVRQRVFSRDGTRCYLCGKNCNPFLPYRHADYPTLDHVVDIADGGAHSVSNCRVACRRCNGRKGAQRARRLREQAERTPSAQPAAGPSRGVAAVQCFPDGAQTRHVRPV